MENDLCDCILNEEPQWEGHTNKDHNDVFCTGRQGWDPPCGGCINCIAMQMYYYRFLDEQKNATKE